MYYNGEKLLNLKDLNKRTPELFLATGNRTSGKTTYFGKKLVNDFIQLKKQFVVLYRFTYELQDVENSFFNDLKEVFFNDYTMESCSKARGMYRELYLNGEQCGYAVCLNAADNIKRNSQVFHNIEHIFFDEFQSETNKYCDDEITKFISIHRSIARGHGKMSRYVPVYMCSNCVSLLNPYYPVLGVCNRLREDTKFLRGTGWVLEQNYNTDASKSQKESAFMQAFSNHKAVAYAGENVYLNDNKTFIGKIPEKGKYLLSYRYKGQWYHITKLGNGYLYANSGYDKTFPLSLAFDISDHNESTVLIHNPLLLDMLRRSFQNGLFRFRDLVTKDSIITLLKY